MTTHLPQQSTHRPCFTPFFNAPYQFILLLNLRSLNFGLTPLSWPRTITLTPYYDGNIIFYLRPLSKTYLGRKKKVLVYYVLSVQGRWRVILRGNAHPVRTSVNKKKERFQALISPQNLAKNLACRSLASI